MNLLLINYEYPPIGGGAGNATQFTSRALADQGHEVVVLTCGWKGHRGYSKVDGVHLYRIGAPRSHPSMASTFEKCAFVAKAWPQLGPLVRRHGITHAIIYFTIPNGPLGWWLKRRFRIPYIVSLRGGDVPGLVKDIDDVHRLIAPLRRAFLRQAHRIVANAEGLAELSRRADPFSVEIIPNGVDTHTFAPPEIRKSKKEFNMVFVGRFHPQKNLEMLFKVMNTLKEKSSRPFKLHMVGEGPDEEMLRFLQEKLGLQENIVWHGWTQKEDLIHIHQRSHLMLNPSLYEGLPNAVLEAMASGLPIVVSDIPGNRDLARPECGDIFEQGNADELLEILLLRMAQSDEELWARGDAARRVVEMEYTWDATARQYVSLFENEGQ